MSVQDHHYKQGPMFGCSDSRCCGVMEPEDGDHCPTCWEYWPCEVELLRQRAEAAEAERDKFANQARHWKEKEAAARASRDAEGRYKHRALQAEGNLLSVSAHRDDLLAKLAAVEALCDASVAGCGYYADEGVPCESHCDCGWGDLWHETVRDVLSGESREPSTPSSPTRVPEAPQAQRIRVDVGLDAAFDAWPSAPASEDAEWGRNRTGSGTESPSALRDAEEGPSSVRGMRPAYSILDECLHVHAIVDAFGEALWRRPRTTAPRSGVGEGAE